MKTHFSLYLVLILSIFYSTSGEAQVQDGIVSYDLVYLKNGKILKGEIIIFEEKDGDITFKDMMGRKYSITREEYSYFIEDQRYYVGDKDTLIVRARKEKGTEFSLGLSTTYINMAHDFTPDDFYRSGIDVYNLIPVCVKVGAGKYIDRQNFIGAQMELGLLGEATSYIGGGLRYTHQYDGYKSNAAFYIPLELNVNYVEYSNNFTVGDTTFFPGGGWELNSDMEVGRKVTSASLHIGQGVSFILENKKSISVEVSLFKNFILSEKFVDLKREGPQSSYGMNGLRLSLLYNL